MGLIDSAFCVNIPNNNKNILSNRVNVKFLTNEAQKMKRFSSESDSGDCSDEKHSRVEVIKSPSSDISNHDKRFPFFRRPRVIGGFSVDADRKYLSNR